MRLLSTCIAVLLIASLATGQEPVVPPQQPPQDKPPVLLAKADPDGLSIPLAITAAKTHVVIRGFIAQTTTTLTFNNSLDRVLEGQLIFPLPDGSTVSGYALDVGGQLIDAIAVEKDRARITFESEVRKGIDPGLVEWVGGNNFRARVWPIPAKGSRTIQVSYVSKLISTAEGLIYELPLQYPEPVKDFELTVEIVKGSTLPKTQAGEFANFRFEQWEDRYVASTHLENANLQEDLRVTIPEPAELTDRQVLVQKDAQGQYYFVVADLPTAAAAARLPNPERIVVLWDASLSRANANAERDLALLKEHLEQLGELQVDLVVFRHVAQQARTFAIRDGDTSALGKHLKAIPFDGATSFDQVRFDRFAKRTKGGPASGYYLLFTDGRNTLGTTLPEKFDAPVFVLNGDSKADHLRLKYMAHSSGGVYLNLAQLTDKQVLSGLGRQPFALTTIDYDGESVAEIYPSGSEPVDGRVVVSGRLPTKQATITLRYSDGQQASFTIRRSDATDTGPVPQLWAQMKLDKLALFPEKNHDDLLTLGKRYGLVTPATSLLVLERLQQYVEYRIVPPKSRPDIYEQYFEAMEELVAEESRSREEQIEHVAAMWDERVAWWDTGFKYPKDFRYDEEPDDSREEPALLGEFANAAQERTSQAVPGRRAAPLLNVEDPPAATGGGGIFGDPSDDPQRVDREFADDQPTMSIDFKPWEPDTPYLKAIKNASGEDAYEVFLRQRRQYFTSPSFYLDCADFFFSAGRADTGLRVLTSVLELELESPALLRIVGHRLDQAGEVDTAIIVFERVLHLRPEEPQSYRDLALVLAKRSNYQRAIEMLEQVVMGQWDERFPDIEVIALMELNGLLASIGGAEDLTVSLDSRLRKRLDVDVRIVLTWDTDLTDIDLWVIEPSTEQCYYGHNRTTIGGLLSADNTGGYGPEEYVIRKAMAGEYAIKAHFFGSGQQILAGPTTVQATIITNFGRPNEERRSLTFRLTEPDDIVEIGRVSFAIETRNN